MASTKPIDGQLFHIADDLFARNPCVQRTLSLLAFVGAYYVAYTYGMAFSQESASPFWFPDSVLLCALLITPYRQWWVLIAAMLPVRFLADVADNMPIWFLASCFVNDSAKGLLTAWALRRFMSNPLRFDSVAEFAHFCVFALLLIPALSAFGGAAARAGLGQDYWLAWEQWFLGNALSQLVVTPFILYWVIGTSWRIPMPGLTRVLEASALAIGLVLACYLSFTAAETTIYFTQARFYAPLPFMIWAAVRFGMLGASGAVAIVAFTTVHFALSGQGPFAQLSPEDTARAIQNFLLLRSAPLFFIAAMLDRNRAAEVALGESEVRFREIADMTPVMLWMADKTGACRFVNNSCIAFSGRGFSEQLGTGWLNAVHPEDLQKNLGVWVTGLLSPRTFECEFRMRRHDGVWRWIVCVMSPRFGANQEFLGYIGSLLDVTERKDAEELKRSVAHIQRLAAMGELTAAIAHEVRQPLTAMRSNCDAAVHMLDAQVPNVKELRETLADINSDSRLAAEVLDRITRFMRKQEKRVEAVDLNEALRDVVRLVKSDAEMRNVHIESNLTNGLERVRGDRTQLMQVMMNLLVNGMDAMAGAPPDLRRLTVRTARHGDCAEVVVEDHGSGITQQNLPFIFDSFFTTKNGGMGLGLAVSRSIIEEHGGQISAANNFSGGATFRFTVPLADDATKLPAAGRVMQAPSDAVNERWLRPDAESGETPRPVPGSDRPPTIDHRAPQ